MQTTNCRTNLHAEKWRFLLDPSGVLIVMKNCLPENHHNVIKIVYTHGHRSYILLKIFIFKDGVTQLKNILTAKLDVEISKCQTRLESLCTFTRKVLTPKSISYKSQPYFYIPQIGHHVLINI